MSCVSCRAELKPNAKFCGSCGAKVQAGGGAEKLIFSPNPLGLRECEVKVIEIKGEGPDGDGDVRFEIKYEVKNRTDEDWEYLVARTQVLDSRGLVVEETRGTNEQTVSAGESAECETYLSIKLKTLGENPEKANVLVSVVACGIALQKLGEFDVPATAFNIVPLKSIKVGNVLQLVSGRLWKTEPDDDKDSIIQVRALVQNLTAMHVHEVKLIAEVTDKVGRDVSDAGGSDEVRPGDVCLISGSGYGKDKQFKGAKVALSLRAYFSAATGLSQHVGIEIHESESRAEVEDDEDSSADDGNGDGADFSLVSSNRLKEGALTQIFYGNMKWFDVAEQPSDIEDIPEAFAEAKSLWEEDKEGNLNQILDLLSEYVGARFLPSNINEWEELFEDQDGNGIPEIEARQVRVVGIDFSSSPIPKCKAEAIFDVEVTNQFLSTDLDEWQESNSPFTDAVVFYWNIPKNQSTEDLDFTAGDNQGVECVCVDQNPFENSGELSASDDMEWQINAGWETRKGNKSICRWFVCWRVVADDQIVGAVAGYSGGSSFEVERFYGKLDGGNLSSLWMDFTDRVTGEEVDFDTLDDEIRSACESALDQIWEWNDNDEWGESDEVVLLKTKREDLAAKKEMLYLAKDSAPFLQTICEKAGLTAAPEPIEKKSVEQALTELYDDNLHLFKKGYFHVHYKDNDFRIYQVDGSYEGSFLTLIHYILFNEKLYEDYFSKNILKLVVRVMKIEPHLPPNFDDDADTDRFDEFVHDATEFTYNYMKDHKLYCEEMNEWIENTEQDWKPLKKQK